MGVYRYSEDGVERIVSKAQRQSFLTVGLALTVGFCLVSFSNPGQILQMAAIFAVLAILIFWNQRRSAHKIRSLVSSTTFELDEDVLKASNSLTTTVIPREEVVELRYMRDGILVRGKELRNTLQLKPELDQFDELSKRIEEWTPPTAKRIHSSASLSLGVMALVLANLGLVGVAFAAENPKVGIPFCIGEILLLGICVAWTFRSKCPRRVKWYMLLTVLPIFGLMSRVAYLWKKL